MATDELNGLLKEISALLHRQVELHEAGSLRVKQSQEEMEKRRIELDADSKKRKSETDEMISRSRVQGEQRMAEERDFKERLLSVLDRQNQALEMILTYLKR